MRLARGISRGNMISILMDSVYGGGPGAAAASGCSNAKGAAAPDAIHARRLRRDFTEEFLLNGDSDMRCCGRPPPAFRDTPSRILAVWDRPASACDSIFRSQNRNFATSSIWRAPTLVPVILPI